MPRNYQQPSTKNGTFDYEFASLRLNEGQKNHFKEWFSENAQAFEDLIASITLEGNKNSFSWDENNDCYIASLTCNNSKSPNHKCVMTSRAEDWFEALMMNVYKYIVVCDNGAWPRDKGRNNWG